MRRPAVVAFAAALLCGGPGLAAAPAAMTKAQSNVLFEKALATMDKDPVESRRLIEEAARSNDPETLNALSMYLRNGIGGPRDEARGRALLEQAAKGGSVGAKLTLGRELIYADSASEQRRGVRMLEDARKDPKVKAIAAAGLGVAYVFGKGVERDVKTGIDLMEESEAGNVKDAHVLFLLGRTYQNGWGGRTADEKKAYGYFREAAEAGWPRASWHVGMALINGEGVSKDEREAYKWVRKAGEADDIEGQISTAVMLATGQGVQEDDAQARVWYQKAADRGSGHALRGLGMMLVTGEGGAADQTRGLAYLELAAEAGDANAPQIIKALEIEITPEGRGDVERIKTEWVAAHGKPTA